MSLNPTTISVTLSAGESNTFGNVAVPNENFVHQAASGSNPLVNGTASGQANHACEVSGTAGTGGVTIDLTAVGAASGLDGKNRDFSNGGSGGAVKSFLLENLDPTNTITVTQPASNGWTGISGAATGLNRAIEPGGHLEFHSPVAGMPVTSTNKQFILTGSAGAPAYKLSLVGVAA